MGWWGTDIMGGDTPLDIEGDIGNKLFTKEELAQHGADYPSELSHAVIRERLAERIEKWKEWFEPVRARWAGYGSEELAYHVIGWMCVTESVKIPDDLKPLIVQAVDNSLATEEGWNWKDWEMRQEELLTFRRRVLDN